MLTLEQVLGNNIQKQRLLTIQTVLNLLRSESGQPPFRGLTPETQIPFNLAVVVWVFTHIAHRGIIQQDALMSVVQMFPKELLTIGEELEAAGIREGKGKIDALPVRVLGLADRRFVSVSGAEGCFDLQECSMQPNAPLTFEGVSYNLAAPVLVECLRIHKEKNNGADSPHAGRTVRPEDLGNGIIGTGNRPARQ
jgi:hypothetical protein